MEFVSLWNSLFGRSHRLRRKPSHAGRFGFVAAEVLEFRELLSVANPGVTLSVQGTSLTLSSTDIDNPNVTVTRSGTSVVVSGLNGTQITLGKNVAATQSVVIPSVSNLTINLGTGNDTFAIFGLGTTGNITINGQSSGMANVSISAGSPNVVIGGSIQANFGSEAATFSLFGSSNGGGSLTVKGSVSVSEGGAGIKQVNLYGPPANNPNGGKLNISGDVSVLDIGNGQSGLRIDDGVTIGGNVSFDNSANTVGGDNVQIYSNSIAFGTTSIGGTLTLALSKSLYQNNFVQMQGFGSSLVVNGAVSITSGGGNDAILVRNDWFKSTVKIDTGSSPSFSKDFVSIDGSRFDAAATVSMSGPYAELDVGTDPQFAPTVFNSSFSASLTGASTAFYLSNATSTVNEVVFNSAFTLTGGSPFGTLFQQGRFFVNPGRFTKTNFNIATAGAPIVPIVLLAVQSGNVVLTSTDINNPNISVTRSGGNIVVSGFNGTRITYGSTNLPVQTVAVPTVNNLTLNLGTGSDTIAISGVSVSGNITINGQSTGIANVSISAGPVNVVIGGSIQANFGGEAVNFNLFGSSQGGGSLTVNGSVNVSESGAGNKQVNLYGPPGNSILVTDYVNARGTPTHVVQNGTDSVIFIDSLGNMVSGRFINPTQAVCSAFPGDVVTFGGNALTWSDGSVWTRSNPSSQVTVTDYVNGNGVATHVIRNGTNNLVFADGAGHLSLGAFINATQAIGQLYPGNVATFSGNKVFWADGSVWTQALSNTNGGKLLVKGSVSVVDTGNGQSGFRIDDGVTIGGNVSFDNSVNIVGGNVVQIYSNTINYGATSIAGSLTLALSQSAYHGDFAEVLGFGSALTVSGPVSITSGAGSDTIHLANAFFQAACTVNAGTSPSFASDVVSIDALRFDGSTILNENGPYARLNLGTNPQFGPTIFNSSLTASLLGASALVMLSNSQSTINEVVFNSTAAFTGGTPFATLVIQGKFFVKPGQLTKKNFN